MSRGKPKNEKGKKKIKVKDLPVGKGKGDVKGGLIGLLNK
jgi:hypothetical protein